MHLDGTYNQARGVFVAFPARRDGFSRAKMSLKRVMFSTDHAKCGVDYGAIRSCSLSHCHRTAWNYSKSPEKLRRYETWRPKKAKNADRNMEMESIWSQLPIYSNSVCVWFQYYGSTFVGQDITDWLVMCQPDVATCFRNWLRAEGCQKSYVEGKVFHWKPLFSRSVGGC